MLSFYTLCRKQRWARLKTQYWVCSINKCKEYERLYLSLVFIYYKMKREHAYSNVGCPTVQLWIQPPDTLQPGVSNPLPLTCVTSWWGAQGFLGLFSITEIPTDFAVLCREKMKSLRSLSKQPGGVVARKLIVTMGTVQVSLRWECPWRRQSWSSLHIRLVWRLTDFGPCYQWLWTIHHLPPSHTPNSLYFFPGPTASACCFCLRPVSGGQCFQVFLILMCLFPPLLTFSLELLTLLFIDFPCLMHLLPAAFQERYPWNSMMWPDQGMG